MDVVAGYVTLTEIAHRADVRLSAVSNWRTRHADFPTARMVSGREVFEAEQVATWLRQRMIPRNLLKPGEPAGASYGDRFVRGAAIPEPSTADGAGHERPHTQSDWPAPLWAVMDRLRGTHDIASSLEFVLSLVYIKTCRPEVWQRLVGAASWPKMREVLADVSLSMGTSFVPMPRTVGDSYDPSLSAAIDLLDKVDFGRGPESVAAQIGESILAQLERRMGRSGGHFTPPDVARCLVGLLDPRLSDGVYDPFCGSGELLSAAAAYVRGNSGSLDGWRVWGQTPQEWSWWTSTMNLALHGVEADLSTPSNALREDRFPDRRFGRILANPPFNLRADVPQHRWWPFGEPPPHNANFAWLQHVVSKLDAGGLAAVLMPAGAASVHGREARIRRSMVEAGVVECVIALPPGLFRFTNIATMIWILRDVHTGSSVREMLFIDGRELGQIVDGARRRLGEDDISRIVGEYWTWRKSRQEPGRFAGTDGFSRAVSRDEIRENDYVLLPGTYVTPIVQRSETAQTITDVGVLRAELDELSKRAAAVRGALAARLASIVGGDRPSGDGWFVPLGTVCDVLSGPGTVSRSAPAPSGTPLVLPRNIENNRIGREDIDVVSAGTAQRMARYRLVAGDIVTARAGTLGRYGLVLTQQTGWLLGPGCLRFRPNDHVDPSYLTYYLGSPAALQWLMEHAIGSAIQHVNAAILRTMPIWLLPKAAQRETVDILDEFHGASALFGRMSANVAELNRLLATLFMAPPTVPGTGNMSSTPPGTT